MPASLSMMEPSPAEAPSPSHPTPGAGNPQAESPANRVELRGVLFDALTQAGAIDHIFGSLDAGRGGWVVTSNLDHLRRATRDAEFRAMLDEADLVVADGTPLVWAARLAGRPVPERVAGSSLTPELAGRAAAAAAGRSLFLLGGNPGVADQAAEKLLEQHPDLRVAGTHCPPMGFENDPAEMDAIRTKLADSGADIVLVALGSPKQEKLIRRLRSEGVLPGAWWLGVGITLSFITGQVNRAPVWMQKAGLEWVHRMVQEPRRLARRYLIEGLPFAAGLVAWAVVTRLRGGHGG